MCLYDIRADLHFRHGAVRNTGTHAGDHCNSLPASDGVYYMPSAVYTFSLDNSEVCAGRRREGIYTGAMTFWAELMRSVSILWWVQYRPIKAVSESLIPPLFLS